MKDKKHYAAIDIGSNAVRLLIKSADEHRSDEPLSKVQLLRVALRLGEDAFTKGYIGKKKSRKLLALMQAYKHLMEIYDVVDYRACATSAMRDAENGQELVRHIYEQTGIAIDIIEGREEAQLISNKLIGDKQGTNQDSYLYVDVGGGSTELNLIRGSELLHSQSFNIGTIRQLSGKVSPEEVEAFRAYLCGVKEQDPTIQVVGTGGNINKLVRLVQSLDLGGISFLPYSALRAIYQELSLYDTEERIQRFRLKPDRADVIIPAAEIFLMVGECLSAEGVIVPTKGLSDGIIESIYRRHHQ